jgi:NitT/TauT family transport system permease protein
VFKLRAAISERLRWVIGAVTVGIFVAVWMAVTFSGLVGAGTLPSPADLLDVVPQLHTEKFMLANALVSLLRITIGFALATALAVPLGVLMGAFTPIRAAVNPLIGPLRFLPIAAVVPIFIFWFGLGEQMKIMLLFIGTFVYLLPLVVETVDQVDDVYLKTAATLGASKWQIIISILVPASLPAIYEALRVMFGIGWTYVMLAEFVSDESSGFGYGGIGYLINNLRRYGTLSEVLVCVILILIIGVVVDFLMGWIGKQLFPWAQRD